MFNYLRIYFFINQYLLIHLIQKLNWRFTFQQNFEFVEVFETCRIGGHIGRTGIQDAPSF